MKTSHSRMPGTTGSRSIPSARFPRPSSWSPEWIVLSSATAGSPPYDWSVGHGLRETSVRAQFDMLRSLLPPTFHEVIAAGLGDQTPFGVLEHVIPSLATQLLRAERTALIRRLHEVGGRSKVGRLVQQLGEGGRSLWESLKARHGARRSGSLSTTRSRNSGSLVTPLSLNDRSPPAWDSLPGGLIGRFERDRNVPARFEE